MIGVVVTLTVVLIGGLSITVAYLLQVNSNLRSDLEALEGGTNQPPARAVQKPPERLPINGRGDVFGPSDWAIPYIVLAIVGIVWCMSSIRSCIQAPEEAPTLLRAAARAHRAGRCNGSPRRDERALRSHQVMSAI